MLATPTTESEIAALATDMLAAMVKRWAEAYYNSDQSEVSDETFDFAVDLLRERSPNHELLSVVGSEAPAESGKVKHLMPMLSLIKETTEEGMKKWMETINAASGLSKFTCFLIEPKLDGSSVGLQYDFGRLVVAITRGDGSYGEDVTHSISKCGIPLIIPEWSKLPKVSVRGEVVLHHSDWAIADPEQLTNPRNVGNGIVRRQSDTSKAHLLTFYAFDVVGDTRFRLSETSNLEQLNKVGFTCADAIQVSGDLITMMSGLESLRARRSDLPYDIDGAVIKPDNISLARDLGVTGGRPRGQRAFKWRSETALTTVLSAVLTVGHTGRIIPTLSLKPIQLGGVTVKSVLANNYAELNRFGVCIGDTVEIIRSGELIPKLVSVHSRSGGKLIEAPECCPACSGNVGHQINSDGEQTVALYCLNDECGAKAVGKVKRWLKSLDILGIGDDLLNNLAESGMVTTVPDLYRMQAPALAEIPMGKGRVGDSRAASIITNVSSRRSLTLIDALGSLGIPTLGKRKVQIILEAANVLGYDDLNELNGWMDQDTLPRLAEELSISGTVDQIVEWFASNQELMVDLVSVVSIGGYSGRISPEMTESDSPEPEGGREVYLLTGKFENPKKEIHAQIEAAGHKFVEDWSKDVTVLVTATADSTSSKAKKAIKAGIPIITLPDLLAKLV